MDTACSSALVAVHNGVRYVRSEGSQAVAAAVNLMLAETTTAAAFAAGMLTQNGRCKTMDASADGYVRCALACVYASRVLQLYQADDLQMSPIWSA